MPTVTELSRFDNHQIDRQEEMVGRQLGLKSGERKVAGRSEHPRQDRILLVFDSPWPYQSSGNPVRKIEYTLEGASPDSNPSLAAV